MDPVDETRRAEIYHQSRHCALTKEAVLGRVHKLLKAYLMTCRRIPHTIHAKRVDDGLLYPA